MNGLVRVAAAVPRLHLGNVEKNVQEHLCKLKEAREKQASLVVFPQLSLTGASCGDLFFQKPLMDSVQQGLMTLVENCPEGITAVVGAPLQGKGGLYNCAVVLSSDGIEGVVPQAFLPEKRHFRAAGEGYVTIAGQDWQLSRYTTFTSADGVTFGIELGEDLFAPMAPSTTLALAGAEIIVNLSAMNEVVGRREARRQAVLQQSARSICGYVYVNAGCGESTSDLVYAGHSLAASCGDMVKENGDFIAEDYLLTADIDIDTIRADRMRSPIFGDSAAMVNASVSEELIWGKLLLNDTAEPDVQVSKQPFIPAEKAARTLRCQQIFALQAQGLARRMAITGGKTVIGISGGLDSTLALLVAVRAVDMLGLPRTNILGVTMPCFGTTDWTYQSALELMTTLGITQREIPIHAAVRQHFKDIGHEESDHSVTYENAQARERTQVLMDVCNDFGGIVLGTGDLSEIALGWCTYNADHMSMYGVNCGVPKTLVRWVVKTASESEEFAPSKAVLERILSTPISPELLPPDEQGNIAQQTEDLVGPYALHDFFLYYAVRYGYSPAKVYQLCRMAFKDDFDDATILKWLKNFYRRFFTQQFKRNCCPDGVKVGTVGLSPRGDWLMPSDAQSALWLKECEAL